MFILGKMVPRAPLSHKTYIVNCVIVVIPIFVNKGVEVQRSKVTKLESSGAETQPRSSRPQYSCYYVFLHVTICMCLRRTHGQAPSL